MTMLGLCYNYVITVISELPQEKVVWETSWCVCGELLLSCKRHTRLSKSLRVHVSKSN